MNGFPSEEEEEGEDDEERTMEEEEKEEEVKRLLMRKEKDSAGGGDGSGYSANVRSLDDTGSSNRNKPRRMRSYVMVMDDKTLDV